MVDEKILSLHTHTRYEKKNLEKFFVLFYEQ